MNISTIKCAAFEVRSPFGVESRMITATAMTNRTKERLWFLENGQQLLSWKFEDKTLIRCFVKKVHNVLGAFDQNFL